MTELEQRIRASSDAAIDYLREQWGNFVGLYSEIIDMQHRAAIVAYNAQQAGDTETADMARRTIQALAELQRKHDATVRAFAGVADYVGLQGYGAPPVGLGAIPVAAVAALTGLALAVVWFFRAAELEERKLELLEDGVLTPAELQLLDPGPAPAMILGQAAGLAKVLLGALVVYVGYRVASEGGFLKRARGGARGRARANPPLYVFDSNPPGGVIGDEVLAVYYMHAEDGNPYVHEFGDDVELLAEPDGTVRLEHRGGKELWQDFELEDDDELEAEET